MTACPASFKVIDLEPLIVADISILSKTQTLLGDIRTVREKDSPGSIKPFKIVNK